MPTLVVFADGLCRAAAGVDGDGCVQRDDHI